MTSSRPLYAPSLTEPPDPRLLFASDTLEINRTVFEQCRVKGRPTFAPYTDEQKACMVRETAYEEKKADIITTAMTLPALLFVMWLAITLDRKVRLLSMTTHISRVWNGRLAKIIVSLFYIAVTAALFKICLSLPDRLQEGRGMVAVACLVVVLIFRREFRAFVSRGLHVDRVALLRFWRELAPAFNKQYWEEQRAARGAAREESKSSDHEEPKKAGREEPQQERWSTSDAEADYDNALTEAQSWADQAKTKDNALARIRTFEKKRDKPNIHPKDALRYRLAIMLLQQKMKALD